MGKLVMKRRYFKNGALAEECGYVDGKRHGVHTFYRGEGNVPQGLLQAADRATRLEFVYDHGDKIGARLRDIDGVEVKHDGTPVRPRPHGVDPTAHDCGIGRGWIYSRSRGGRFIEIRRYDDQGTLRSETDESGYQRDYHDNGNLHHEGRTTTRQHRQVGTWKFYAREGGLRCTWTFKNDELVRQSWHTADGRLEGLVHDDLEYGTWTGSGRSIDLGPAKTETQLLAHRVTADVLVDAVRGDHTMVGTLARARRAGIARDRSLLGAPLLVIDRDELFPPPPKGVPNLIRAVNALRWEEATGERLADVAAALFRGGRAQAALDVLEAAFLFGDRQPWHTARTAYQRASGHLVEEPRGLDARAHALLAQIRTNPGDNGPRLVFADHIAGMYPEHAELIVSQCAGRSDADIGTAFRATLPSGFLEVTTNRGFLDRLCLDTLAFLAIEPELLERVAPACRSLELHRGTQLISQIVAMPSLARFTELRFRDMGWFDEDAQLVHCKYLDQLESLDLRATGFDDVLHELCRGFPRLQNLDIGGDGMLGDARALRTLANAIFAPTLRRLTIQNQFIGDRIVKLIAKLPSLEYLDLEISALTDKGARGLLALPNKWRELRLADHQLSERMLKILTARLGKSLVTNRELSPAT